MISEAKATLVKLTNDHQNEVVQSLRETQNQILTLGDAIHATAEQLSRNEVRAPEAGVVTDLRVHTPGGVIAAGAPVLDLVPRQDRLVVMARLRPEDIDVVHEGAEAEITLLPFNPKKVRPLKGKVVTISADRLLDKRTDQPYYSARIAVDESGADASAVSAMAPGMPARSSSTRAAAPWRSTRCSLSWTASTPPSGKTRTAGPGDCCRRRRPRCASWPRASA